MAMSQTLPEYPALPARNQLAELVGGNAQSSEELLERALKLIAEANDLLTVQRAKIDTLENLVDKDEMTGLLNRRGLEEHVARELARVRRKQSRGCALVICDLDGFKGINDNYGHPAGDAAIRAVGDFFTRTVRDTDMTARLGGDEFALVLTNIDAEKAAARAKAISFGLNNLSFKWEDHMIALRGSFGLTSCEGTGKDKFEKLYRAADEALYRAKQKQQEVMSDK